MEKLSTILTEETVDYSTNRKQLCSTVAKSVGESTFNQKYKDCDDWQSQKFANENTIKELYDFTQSPPKQFEGSLEEFYKKYACDKFPNNQYCKSLTDKEKEEPKNNQNGNTEIGNDDKKKEPKNSGSDVNKEKEQVKYPLKAPQNIVDRFDSKYPCLKDLPTMVNLDKDGNEYYYKVEKPTEDETVYYYMSGKCKIKTGDQISSKYFKCP